MKDRSVVIIDSDGEDCFILQEAFKRWRPTVRLDQFCSPADYFESSQWKIESPSVILLELVLIGQDGLDWVPVFLGHECCQTTPVVVYSSLEAERQLCLKAGATDFIKKPSGFDEMRLIVDKVWQNWLTN